VRISHLLERFAGPEEEWEAEYHWHRVHEEPHPPLVVEESIDPGVDQLRDWPAQHHGVDRKIFSFAAWRLESILTADFGYVDERALVEGDLTEPADGKSDDLPLQSVRVEDEAKNSDHDEGVGNQHNHSAGDPVVKDGEKNQSEDSEEESVKYELVVLDCVVAIVVVFLWLGITPYRSDRAPPGVRFHELRV
jgi:hypothetical protein